MLYSTGGGGGQFEGPGGGNEHSPQQISLSYNTQSGGTGGTAPGGMTFWQGSASPLPAEYYNGTVTAGQGVHELSGNIQNNSFENVLAI